MSTITPHPQSAPATGTHAEQGPPGWETGQMIGGRRVPQIMDHEYDGIKEYDNPTPAWWHAIFIASVIFSLMYWVYWQMGPDAPTIHDQWKQHQVAEYRKLFGSLGELKPDEPTFLRMMADSKMQEVARGIFEGNCAACHAKDGGGITGPNLCDNNYKNVKKIEDIYTTITNGAASGAMPTWRNRLGENERIIVASFVANLRGTTPKAPRAPEGDVCAPWPTAAAVPAVPPAPPAPAKP